ncbi:tetratricopeptide repeat protein [Nitrosospira sp. Nsp13]|uniref:tetratricopeptide repeat protein n=1 Tax=Nitrosospira sp. Nsp13 TaxID=1855332 RepID=UPI0008904E4B|nr:tetratricopeptide repeat protein [Nitrosospira sp. Nsp13]SCX77776.1 Predicted methyltransferase, contains TPR repeat [Nitrosospira sp. Nsp13]
MHPDVQNEVESERETISELSLPDALALALQIHRRGHLTEAETLYRKVLDIAPDCADAQHFLGVLLHQGGDSDSGIELIRKSIALDLGEPNYYNNLGNVLVEMERLAEAAEAYKKVIALAPDHANAHNNLGALSKALGRFDEAAAAYQKAIELNPDHVDAHNNMGKLLSAQGKTKEAIAWYCKAITLMRHNPDSRKLLGIAYYTLGQTEKAAEVYRQWLAEEPDSPVAKHMLSACSGQNVPPRASDEYVESTFDRFADSFDAKLEKLAYRAPDLIAEALASACGAPEKRLMALDAGCGTGLCGPLITQYIHRLVGVDLSSGMLAKARGRNTYDELIKSELTTYLLAQSGAFNLIVSADTLVYFGSLEEVLDAAHRALQEDGLLIFTVEAAADEATNKAISTGYRINPHGRYSHSNEYLRQVLPAAGFSMFAIEPAVLRMEGGSAVAGWVVTSRKANSNAIKDDRTLTAVPK